LAIVALYFAKNIQRTAVGRRFIAVRDNDLSAEVMGINLFRTKLLAFFVGCFFAGVAGWLTAYFYPAITPDMFDFKLSLWFLGMIIVGGIGSTTGAVLGATLIMLVDRVTTYYISPALQDWFPDFSSNFGHAMTLIIFAGVVMFFIVVEPRGLYHRFQRLKLYYRLHPFSY
jgi:branched-chain amino acid transport system permease protein